LEDALSILEKLALSNDEIVFRGHAQSNYRICSTLSRYSAIPHENWDSRLDDMLSHFLTNLRSIGELPADIARDRRARLEYGRHYGVPSPLIDFSLSPYIALFFAFNGTRPDKNKDDKNVVVCALDVRALGLGWAKMCTQLHTDKLNEECTRFIYEREPLFENGYPAGVLKFIRFPASWNKRMQRQMGVFIYDSLDYRLRNQRDLEDFIAALKEPEDGDTGIASPTLTKVLIPRSIASDAFSRLELMGINATRLYDDHDGAAADVNNAYNYNRKTGYAWDLRMFTPDENKM
jgi:hypothetical protein